MHLHPGLPLRLHRAAPSEWSGIAGCDSNAMDLSGSECLWPTTASGHKPSFLHWPLEYLQQIQISNFLDFPKNLIVIAHSKNFG